MGHEEEAVPTAVVGYLTPASCVRHPYWRRWDPRGGILLVPRGKGVGKWELRDAGVRVPAYEAPLSRAQRTSFPLFVVSRKQCADFEAGN
ncbi:hypothetical protein SLA2020_156410 [Shorea laevis]